MEFRTADHSACLQEGQTSVRKRSVRLLKEALAETIVGATFQGARQLHRVVKIRTCLTVQSSTVNGTALGSQEWWDSLFLRYGL